NRVSVTVPLHSSGDLAVARSSDKTHHANPVQTHCQTAKTAIRRCKRRWVWSNPFKKNRERSHYFIARPCASASERFPLRPRARTLSGMEVIHTIAAFRAARAKLGKVA